MLATANRLRSREDFQEVTRSGRRVRSNTLTGFILSTNRQEPARFGFQVSKKIGGSVQRHRVLRQLRHLTSPWVLKTPNSTLVVIRPNTHSMNYQPELDSLMEKLIERRRER